MLCPIRSLRFVTCRFISSPVIREMSPQFQNLKLPDCSLTFSDTRNVLNEVIRCNSFLDNVVFENCIKLLENSGSEEKKNRQDALVLAKIRLIAIAYYEIDDEVKRRKLKKMIHKVGKCRIEMFQKEVDLFVNSLESSSPLPVIQKCMNKNELVLCYLRRELCAENWTNIRNLIENNDSLDIYKFLDEILEVIESQKVDKLEFFDFFMRCAQKKHRYFVESQIFQEQWEMVLKFCGIRVQKIAFNDRSLKKLKREYIEQENLNKLKELVDDFVKRGNESHVKIKEYNKIGEYVARWKKRMKNVEGENLVVVDALNFGRGRDPKNWDSLSSRFKNVVFVTRIPPRNVYDEVVKRYKGNALFCDKLSTDDLIILRIAWEFGPKTSVVTNDLYRDHRLRSVDDKGMKNVWDDWMIDSVYKHDCRFIEPHREFTLRIRQIDNRTWIIPIVTESPEIRNIQMVRVVINNDRLKKDIRR